MFERLKIAGQFSRVLNELIKAGYPIEPTVYDLFRKEFPAAARFMRERGCTVEQANVFLITNLVHRGAQNGALEVVRAKHPEIYRSLRILYTFCELALAEHPETVGAGFIVGEDSDIRPFAEED